MSMKIKTIERNISEIKRIYTNQNISLAVLKIKLVLQKLYEMQQM